MRRLSLLVMLAALIFALTTISAQSPVQSAAAQQVACPGAPPTRFAVGVQGTVSPTAPGTVSTPLRVRNQPSKTGQILLQLRDGAQFSVTGGPKCADGYLWWQIKTDNNVTGWVAEGDTSGYYIDPVAGGSSPTVPANATAAPISALPPANQAPPGDDSGFQAKPFSEYKPGKVNTSASLQPYAVAPDFANTVITSALSKDQLDYVQRNAFVVSPGSELEFYTVYEKARYNYEPLFITTDSLLHSFHLVFDKVLRTAESSYFVPLLQDMNAALLSQTDAQYQALKSTDWEAAAQRTVAYLGVAAKLADPSIPIPAYVQDSVNKELALINAAQGIAPSVIFPELKEGEDYSQYIPRGHYTRSDALKTYFRSMMWYGRLTFRLSKPEETKSALLLVQAVRTAKVNGKRGLDAWNDLYAPTVFFVGHSDALTIPQYIDMMAKVYGATADVKAIQAKGIDPFVSAATALPAPKILNAVIQDTDDIAKETKGLRFMGQRFVWDAYAFRELIYRNVGTRDKPRALPMALDVFAALGSERALQLLDKQGATGLENYTKQMTKVRNEVSTLNEANWTETLYGAWLYTLTTLGQPAGASYPSFMLNDAYQDRSLYSALGSFAELKHDTILYAEQAYAEMGGGGGKSPAPEPVMPLNYVEPLPLFWARLAALAEMTDTGLGSRQLLSAQDAETLKSLAQIARRLQKDSQLELQNKPLGDEEQKLLRFYGGDLEKIYTATADPKDNNQGPAAGFTDQPQAAIVADVATDPASQKVLELGIGRVFDIYAAVPAANGKLSVTHGAVFSFYEFTQPLSNRLTDESWQKLLDSGKAPDVPAWTSSFMAKETVDKMLSEAVRSFQTRLVGELWYSPEESYSQTSSATDNVSKFIAKQLEPLVKAKQYEGRQMVEVNFRSFDMKDAKTAIVTTRETIRGELHNNNPTDPNLDGPKVATRGPYSVDVTYTLTLGQNGWAVTNVVSNTPFPPWTKIAG